MEQPGGASRLEGKRILLGVSGGIAAYKACDLASRLVQEKAQVTAILTHQALKFVTPYTFEALTGRPCLSSMFKRIAPGESPYPHLDPAGSTDLLILAPATAHLLARLAAGFADELLPTLCLSVRCPVLLCPAMNVQMWEHPATRRNLKMLAGFGYRILGPASGTLACGTEGAGRMVEPAEILAAACKILCSSLPARPSFPGSGAKGRGRRRGKKRKPGEPGKGPPSKGPPKRAPAP